MKSDFDGVAGVAAEARAEGRRRVGKGRVKGERRWKRWLAGARAQGRSDRELVVEMHLCRELPLPKVAEVLGLKLKEVQGLWLQARMGTMRGMTVPNSKEDLVVLREQMGALLWHTVAESCFEEEAEACGAMTTTAKAAAAKRRVPALGVRLKALKQIAELYGVNPKAKTKVVEPKYQQVEPATPEEISMLVREWLEERGKGGGRV
ncbi:hypothetical protein [Prosthecobacter sp.]|uniref:hypothetical protein n=1 Tax=Prosthecobacter sp. TaxID=1965333 RepID=UPI0037831B2E